MNADDGPYSTGMIHGRFQPFHRGHLKYLQEAIACTQECLLVGITNPDAASQVISDSSDPHRHLPASNPFSFVDRARMISRSLDIDLRHHGLPVVLIVPFDIHASGQWGWIPSETVQFVNVLEPWDEVKVERFKVRGYKVRRIPHPRVTSGSAVRAAMNSEDILLELSSLVPAGTIEVLSNLT